MNAIFFFRNFSKSQSGETHRESRFRNYGSPETEVLFREAIAAYFQKGKKSLSTSSRYSYNSLICALEGGCKERVFFFKGFIYICCGQREEGRHSRFVLLRDIVVSKIISKGWQQLKALKGTGLQSAMHCRILLMKATSKESKTACSHLPSQNSSK